MRSLDIQLRRLQIHDCSKTEKAISSEIIMSQYEITFNFDNLTLHMTELQKMDQPLPIAFYAYTDFIAWDGPNAEQLIQTW